ncbi:MAG: TonB family protein [Bacteroidota bacterium]|nr:TonB family protein [Bacteroidota bacterium]
MKKLIYILILLFSFGIANAFSQKDSVIETMPDYPGGMNALVEYLRVNIKYPQDSKENGYMGKPLYKFVIDTLGSIGNVELCISSEHADLDAEGMRVILGMPKWKPGTQNGKKVPVYFNLPINFKLGPNSEKAELAYKIKWQNKYADYYFNKGVKLFSEEKYKEALESFESTLAISRNDIDALYNKSTTLIKLGRNDEACETLERIKKLGKTDGDALIKKYCENYTPQPVDTNIVYTVVEKMPTYPEGDKGLSKFVKQNFDYNKTKNEKYELSNVSVRFVINTLGNVEKATILRSCGNPIIDQEAIRVVNSITGWIPGMQNGTKVKVYYNLTVPAKKV